jgi:hypothetical protein
MLENLQGVGPQILPGILDLYLNMIQSADTPDLKVMVIQGVMMSFWYDFATTQNHLESRGATNHIMEQTL